MEEYIVFVGIYDHKLGPVCITPQNRCRWLKDNWENPSGLIQDGLNTRAAVFNIKKSGYVVQVHKFYLENPALRGGRQRCCLFVIVPETRPLLPEETLVGIIEGYLKLADENDKDLACPACDQFVVERERELNELLVGSIGEGQREHRKRDLLTAIIGYSQLLADGALGELNQEQEESVTYILKYAREILDL